MNVTFFVDMFLVFVGAFFVGLGTGSLSVGLGAALLAAALYKP